MLFVPVLCKVLYETVFNLLHEELSDIVSTDLIERLAASVAKNRLVAPVVKWVGGKRQLLDSIRPLLPKQISSYCEPFVGGGALLFDLQPKKAAINDINADLISMYRVIRDNVEALIETLATYKNTSEFFYKIRDLDRAPDTFSELSDVEKAARFIYLNKTCYNGLYRVNNAGEFNVPFGSYKNPNIVNAPVLRAVSKYINVSSISMTTDDYTEVLADVKKGTFVYLDPPYDPISSTSNFTGYTKGGFTREDQIRLRECCDALDKRGVKFLLSNSATDFIKEQYAGYYITIVQAQRNINSVGSRRGNIDEVLVRNYE